MSGGFISGGGWADMSEAVWEGGTQSEVADGVDTAAYSFDTDNPWVLGNLAEWKNNGVTKAYIDNAGQMVLNADGPARRILTLGSDAYDPVLSTSSTWIHLKAGGSMVSVSTNVFRVASHLSNNLDMWNNHITSRNYNEDFIIQGHNRGTDETHHALIVQGGDKKPTAVNYLEGGELILRGGAGASASLGDAHGGDVVLAGGTGYGTGSNGKIKLTHGELSSSVVDAVDTAAYSFDTDNPWVLGNLASWSNNGVEKVSFDKDGVVSAKGGLLVGNFRFSFTAPSSELLISGENNQRAIKIQSGISNGAYLRLGKNNWSNEGNFELRGPPTATDSPLGDCLVWATHASATAVNNLVGSSLSLRGGDGASASLGDAHGGDVILAGGTGYGTGSNGHIKLQNIPITDPGETGAIWNDSGTLKVSL